MRNRTRTEKYTKIATVVEPTAIFVVFKDALKNLSWTLSNT
jgi:hypothetical protein